MILKAARVGRRHRGNSFKYYLCFKTYRVNFKVAEVKQNGSAL